MNKRAKLLFLFSFIFLGLSGCSRHKNGTKEHTNVYKTFGDFLSDEDFFSKKENDEVNKHVFFDVDDVEQYTRKYLIKGVCYCGSLAKSTNHSQDERCVNLKYRECSIKFESTFNDEYCKMDFRTMENYTNQTYLNIHWVKNSLGGYTDHNKYYEYQDYSLINEQNEILLHVDISPVSSDETISHFLNHILEHAQPANIYRF